MSDKQRDSGIELLRIIAILMVIAIHLFLYGNYFEEAKQYGGTVEDISLFFRLMFRPAVNIFIIITGYFMVKSKQGIKNAYKRVLKMYVAILFYSVVLTIFTMIVMPESLKTGGKDMPGYVVILKMFMPVLAQNWYYISDYILLCLVAPFVNIMLLHLSKKQYQLLLVVSSVLMSGWFFLGNIKPLDDVVRLYGYSDLVDGKNVFSFLLIYMIGGYISLHVRENEFGKWIYMVGFFSCAVINFLLAKYCDSELGYDEIAIKYTNPLIILMAVFALLFFRNVHFYSKKINVMASATLGVYAIHEFKYIREAIWDVFDYSKIVCNDIAINIFLIIVNILVIFLCCTVIELLRKKLFDFIGSRITKTKPYLRVATWAKKI